MAYKMVSLWKFHFETGFNIISIAALKKLKSLKSKFNYLENINYNCKHKCYHNGNYDIIATSF